jgi:hypothetical protein
VLHLRLIILSVGGDVPVNSEAFLVTDFVNLKIKPTQSFEGAHKDRVCMRVFIELGARICISICVCTVFLKKINPSYEFLLGRNKSACCRIKTHIDLTAKQLNRSQPNIIFIPGCGVQDDEI